MSALGERDGALNSFLQVFDTPVSGSGEGPLAGFDVGVKDNICLNVGRTTCASRMLETYESPYTATAAQRLLDAGASIVGKTNLDEFAMGSSCEHSAFGATRNPWDTDRVPGGSSGGSAAAVAAGLVRLALGSDTGGSIRQPASLCGVVGMKPTYGRVSRFGLVAFGSSLDQIGPFARSVEDAALCLGVIAGEDPRDATCLRHPVDDYAGAARDGHAGNTGALKIGVPKQSREEGVHDETRRVFDDAVRTFRDTMGAEIVEIDLPMIDHGVAAYYIVAPAEASSNLARFDGVRYGSRAELGSGDGLEELYVKSRGEGFGDEVKRRIMLGTHVLSSGYNDRYYLTAQKARRVIRDDYGRCFAQGIDAILTPTCPSPAFRIGEKTDDPLALYLEDVFTVGANLAGLPAISVPAGFGVVDGKRLPVGVQLLGPSLSESALFRIAAGFEAAAGVEPRIAPSFA